MDSISNKAVLGLADPTHVFLSQVISPSLKYKILKDLLKKVKKFWIAWCRFTGWHTRMMTSSPAVSDVIRHLDGAVGQGEAQAKKG